MRIDLISIWKLACKGNKYKKYYTVDYNYNSEDVIMGIIIKDKKLILKKNKLIFGNIIQDINRKGYEMLTNWFNDSESNVVEDENFLIKEFNL